MHSSLKIKIMYEKVYPNKRFKLTLEFIKKHMNTSESILDIGVDNPFSKIMKVEGFAVINTSGEDLDEAYRGMERIENSAQILAEAIKLGGLNPLPAEEVQYLYELRKKIGDVLL